MANKDNTNKQQSSFLDRLVGGAGNIAGEGLGFMKNIAGTDFGKQLLSGLITQAVSDQSYGNKTFLSGMMGANEELGKYNAQKSQEELLSTKYANEAKIANAKLKQQQDNADRSYDLDKDKYKLDKGKLALKLRKEQSDFYSDQKNQDGFIDFIRQKQPGLLARTPIFGTMSAKKRISKKDNKELANLKKEYYSREMGI